MKRPCLDCGIPTDGTRCVVHRRTTARGLGADHQRLRLEVLLDAGATERGIGGRCAMCGRAGTVDDPLTADHVIARVDGGQNVIENYRAVCRSFNSSRGASGTGGSCSTHRLPEP